MLFYQAAVAVLSAAGLVAASQLSHPNLIRTVDLSSAGIVREQFGFLLQNDGKDSVASFDVSLLPQRAARLAHVSAGDRKTGASFSVEPVSHPLVNSDASSAKKSKTSEQIHYSVQLDSPLGPGERRAINVNWTFTGVLSAVPAEITQASNQKLLYTTNVYAETVYPCTKQKTVFKLPSEKIESFTNAPAAPSPVELGGGGRTITYGPYENVAPGSEHPVAVHYVNNQHALTVRSLRRDVEVAQLGGNVAVEEHVHIQHSGAALKGDLFDRIGYANANYFGQSQLVVPGFVFDIPYDVENAPYVRDEIGNVSTSSFIPSKSSDSSANLIVRPRYPLAGGWNYTFYYGYDLPIQNYVKYDSNEGKYKLRVPLVKPVEDTVVDELEFRAILPEGAYGAAVYAPVNVDAAVVTTHHTFLDTTGRTTVVIRKKNVVGEHAQNVIISYHFSYLRHFQKPIVVSLAIFSLFVVSLIVSFLSTSSSSSKSSKKKND
ncbi:Ribophorin I [Ramicandelaber brevisporus]|nr:Ribophorin I [Ramicandelaber brevisporus]